jgi:hypothetical protein
MAQLTVPGTAGRTRARNPRTMRSERVVSLRQTMPRGYVTLRKEIPVYLTETTTPKVETARETARDETPARKGGEAR